VDKAPLRPHDETRYFLEVTNVARAGLLATETIFGANERSHQENVPLPWRHGVQALRMPSDGLGTNGAHPLIGLLASNSRARMATLALEKARCRELRQTKYQRFVNTVQWVRSQIVTWARGVQLRISK